MPNGMEYDNILYSLIEGFPDSTVVSKLVELYVEIFSDADTNFFKQRISEHPKLLTILAFHDEQLIGFKIGYPYNDSTFYSWIGGVHPDFRKRGVALKLSELQEANTRMNGFQKLRTKSMNAYKPMMILNLKNGFDIVKFYTNTKGQTKIVFEKELI
ncbi:MAG: GNAT family N-acetyltransferase [Bacteroidetes bacterium]|nr:MAG: GNAT family N-acetyltransferase [Bacteroidota bacterium]